MKKALPYLGQFAIVVAGVLTALKVYEQLNKPKTLPPATTPAASAGTPAAGA